MQKKDQSSCAEHESLELETAEIRQKLKDYFSKKDQVDTVLLFGSFAKGCATSHSDIDIAIHGTKEFGYEELSEIQTDLSLLCRREIDLADLSVAEGLFLYQIMTSGVKIKIEPTVFVRYLTKALCFKEDFMPVIERFQKEKIRRFING